MSMLLFIIVSFILVPANALSISSVRKRVVIVGGGIGGLSCAFDCKHLLCKDDEIVVVSERELFQFTPSNPCKIFF